MSIHPALLHTIIRPLPIGHMIPDPAFQRNSPSKAELQADADKHVTRHFVSQVGYLWVIWTIVEIPDQSSSWTEYDKKVYTPSRDGKSLLLWHTVRMTKEDVDVWIMEDKHEWNQVHDWTNSHDLYYVYDLYEM